MLTGVILAGASSRGEGEGTKGLLPFGDVTLLEHQIRTMAEACSEMIVVTNDPTPLLPLLDPGVRIITDFYRGAGPLAGMHSGIALSSNPHAWVVGCDMPYASARAALFLLERIGLDAQAAVPIVDGLLHPLHAVYAKGSAQWLERLLKQQKASFAELLQRMRWTGVPEDAFVERGIPANFVTTLDSMGAYRRAATEFAAKP